MHYEKGIYCCGACSEPLFESNAKFDAHCGWPSFDESIPGKIEYIVDNSLGMKRVEIVCTNCGGHLGHVFNDGPTKTGQRYCVNSLSIDFKESKKRFIVERTSNELEMLTYSVVALSPKLFLPL